MKYHYKNLLFKFCVLLSVSSLSFAEAVWIDVRSPAEHAEDSIEGDIHIPHDEIAKQISSHVKDKDTEIKLYCRSGGRAGKAKTALQALGYTRVSNEGGIGEVKLKRQSKEQEGGQKNTEK